MAIATPPAELPPAAARQVHFEQGVAYALHLWPALSLAVQSQWGGPDSADKRDWFVGAIVDLFPPMSDAPATQKPKPKAAVEPDLEDIETVLLQVMFDEFEVNVDDDSGIEVARQVMRVRAQCALGQYYEVTSLRERFMNLKGRKVDQLFKRGEEVDQDTDWESVDEEESDEDDNGAGDGHDEDERANRLPQDAAGNSSSDNVSKQDKPEPQVDAEGFTVVIRKKR